MRWFRGMKYGSVCSGIEAATVAWHPLGWQPQFFSEIEKFPCKVLSHHFPSVSNYGDLSRSGYFKFVGISHHDLTFSLPQTRRLKF